MNCSAGTPRISMSNSGASILRSPLNPASSSNISIARRWSFALTAQKFTAVCASLVTAPCAAISASSFSARPSTAPAATMASRSASCFAASSSFLAPNPSPVTWTIWFTTRRRVGTFSFSSDDSSRPLSEMPSTVGIVTMTNSVVFSFRNRSFTSWSCALSFSSFATASSCLPSSTPKSPFTASVADVSFCRRRTIFPMLLSKKSGSDSNRSVCPVGAVSNTILVNLAYFSSLMNCTTLDIAIASSSPGGGVSRSSPSLRSPS
mmetsp:Transcript_2549/g.8168  ORF Transcript_2549/g.8168 Transcript_2549/m.8168 type:complete len:263 (-) Transcript_2549:545-1333(-)